MQRRKLDGLGLASVDTLLILEQTSGRPYELRSSVMQGVQGEAPDHRAQAGVMAGSACGVGRLCPQKTKMVPWLVSPSPWKAQPGQC